MALHLTQYFPCTRSVALFLNLKSFLRFKIQLFKFCPNSDRIINTKKREHETRPGRFLVRGVSCGRRVSFRAFTAGLSLWFSYLLVALNYTWYAARGGWHADREEGREEKSARAKRKREREGGGERKRKREPTHHHRLPSTSSAAGCAAGLVAKAKGSRRVQRPNTESHLSVPLPACSNGGSFSSGAACQLLRESTGAFSSGDQRSCTQPKEWITFAFNVYRADLTNQWIRGYNANALF